MSNELIKALKQEMLAQAEEKIQIAQWSETLLQEINDQIENHITNQHKI